MSNALNQAVYLGMSWTWCIGMFLPVLLIRDYGPWAWWVFAIPNVLGAAAMGWVIRSPEHSVAYVKNHETAIRLFSTATVAFQVFFAIWMCSYMLGLLGLIVFLGGLVGFSTFARGSLAPMCCAAVMLTSLVLWVISSNHLIYPPAIVAPSVNLIWLSLSCAAGFLTCPYLDITFHHARQQCASRTESKIAFGIGFGVFFLSMIIFTLLYATNAMTSAALAKYLAIHIALQTSLTCALHTQAEQTLPPARLWHRIVTAVAWLVAIVLGMGLIINGIFVAPDRETTYRCFMAFYGLIFPAYVIIHLRAGQRKHWLLLAATVALAGPMFYAAFIAKQMIWLLPGVATLGVAYIAADVIRKKFPAGKPAGR